MTTTRRSAALIASFCVSIGMLAAGCEPEVDAASRLQRANEANAVGDHQTAIAELKQLLLISPDDANARKMLGLAWLMEGDAPAAEAALERALDLGAPIAEIRMPLTEALIMQSKAQEVLDLANQDPGNSNAEKAEVWFMRGAAHFTLNDMDEARASLDEAAKFDPANPRVVLTQAAIYVQTNQTSDAIEALREAQDLAADNPELLSRIGFMLTRIDELDQAETAFRKGADAATTSREREMVMQGMIELQLKKNDFEGARRTLAEFREMDPDNPGLSYIESRLLEAEIEQNIGGESSDEQ